MQYTVAALATLLVSALASPTPTLEKRASGTYCGQYDVVTAAPYIFYTNLWGESGYTGNGAGQCAEIVSTSSSNFEWNTNWTWTGGQYQVKSYTNVGLQMTAKQISAISSIPTKWSWSYTGSNIVADVSYDLFTASSASGNNEYEIMVWLGALGGAGPISSSGSPVATPTIAGTSWKLYKGPNGSTTVYSFVAGSSVQNFNADLLDFLKYLETSQGFSSSQYLKSIQAGTEPFTGSNAVLKTTQYSVSLK